MFESLLIMLAVFASFMLMVSIAIATSVLGFFIDVFYSLLGSAYSFFMDIFLWIENLFDPATEVFMVLVF